MLLDVLSKLDTLQICEAYDIDGERTTQFPSHIDDLALAKPVLRALPGWKSDITHIRRFEDLPVNAQRYVEAIGELVGVPVDIVSVGPDRDQTILRA